MSDFCFPLRPDQTLSSSPQRMGSHQRTFTGIELPLSFLQQHQNQKKQHSQFVQNTQNNPSLQKQDQPSSQPDKAIRKHKHRRSGAISIDLKASAPGLVPALSPLPSSSSIPPVPSLPTQYSSYSLSNPPSPNHSSPKSGPRVQFANDTNDFYSLSKPSANTPFPSSLEGSTALYKHKKVKSWSGSDIQILNSSLHSYPPSPPLISDPPSTPPTNYFAPGQIADISMSTPHEYPSYNPIYYSSSYIDSSQLVVGIPTSQTSASTVSYNSAPSEPVIDLDAALSPFRNSQDSKPGFSQSHRRSESAPESVFESLNNRFHSFNKPVDNEDVIIEEEDEDVVMSPTVPSAPQFATSLTPPPITRRRASNSAAVGQHQEAHFSSTSVNSIGSGGNGVGLGLGRGEAAGGSLFLASNKDRDRARYARNYNTLSLSTTGSLLALTLKNHSSSSILSDISGNAFHNSASSNNTSLSNITSVIRNEKEEGEEEGLDGDVDDDDHNVNDDTTSVIAENPESRVTPRITVEDPQSNVKLLNRLSSTTNDTLTPSVSTPPHTTDSNGTDNVSQQSLQQKILSSQSSLQQGIAITAPTPNDQPLLLAPKAFHLKSLRNVASFEESNMFQQVSQPSSVPCSPKARARSSSSCSPTAVLAETKITEPEATVSLSKEKVETLESYKREKSEKLEKLENVEKSQKLGKFEKPEKKMRFHKKVSSMLLSSDTPRSVSYGSYTFNKSHSTHGLTAFLNSNSNTNNGNHLSIPNNNTHHASFLPFRRASCVGPSSASTHSFASDATGLDGSEFKKSHKKRASRVWSWVRGRHA